jgi:tetratricopeptide (TPR) repeat protein
MYGSAALVVEGAPVDDAEGRTPVSVWLRPKAHGRDLLRPGLHGSAELCGGCHRKSWNLPQNGFRWMPGPDEYREWQAGRFAGASVFAVGDPVARRSCLGCHSAHGRAGARSPGAAATPSLASSVTPPMGLDVFLRRTGARSVAEPLDEALPFPPGESALLDIVVRNAGIGHDFPFGMPDLHDCWLEVRVETPDGRAALASSVPRPDGTVAPGAHAYRLVARDRRGAVIRHGNLDEMVQVAEWRRIPAGDADLARYRLAIPAEGLGAVSVRLLRRRRPDFSRWAGEPVRQAQLLAEISVRPGTRAGAGGGDDARGAPLPPLSERWRHYGTALASVRAYPHAIHALNRALQVRPDDRETLLCLGRVYLDEGDLLAALEQFRKAAAAGGAERARAWEAAALRRMGQPEQAVALLRPLAARYPRDVRLHFELGQAYMTQLRNREAAREFEAMLDVDPLDSSGHYSLTLSRQRLNQFSAARREQGIYRLLGEDSPPAGPSARAPGRPVVRSLDVRPLEEVR